MTEFSLELLQQNAKIIINEESEIKLFNELLSNEININVYQESRGWNNIIFQHKGQHIRYHREVNPFGEFTDLIGGAADDTDYLVCIGSGFGYQFHNTLDLFSRIPRVLIVDPFFDSLFTFLSTMPLSNILPRNARILFAPEPRIVTALLKKTVYRYHPTKLGFVTLDSIKTLVPDYINQIQQEMQESWKRHSIFIKTEEDQHSEIRSNVSTNLSELKEISTLTEGSAGGNRALLVGSGPSVEQLLPLIGQAQNKITIVAAGSALSILLRAGIKPDLAVVADPQSLNLFHFTLESFHVPLAFCPVIAPEIVERFAGPKFIINSGHLILETISRLLNIPKVFGWGTISSIALDLLRQLGFKEIALAGMDFSYRGGQSHAVGYAFRGRREKVVRRENRFGQRVNTTTTLADYAEFTDRQVAELIEGGTSIINLMQGGLLRSGTPMTGRHYYHYLLGQKDQPKPGYRSRNTEFTSALQETLQNELTAETAHVETLLKMYVPGESTMTELFSNYPLSIIEGALISTARDFEQLLIENKGMEEVYAEWGKFKEMLLKQLNDMHELLASSINRGAAREGTK